MWQASLKDFWRQEEGQDLLEYALLMGFIALAAGQYEFTLKIAAQCDGLVRVENIADGEQAANMAHFLLHDVLPPSFRQFYWGF